MKARPRRGLYAPELLESRIAPATFVVMNLNDTGTDSLRDAVSKANAHPGLDTITFKPGLSGTIDLTSAQIGITEAVTIKGPGLDVITISGEDTHQIFTINYTADSLVPTAISGLSLIDGKSSGDGGAIYSKAPLTLKNVVVASSTAASIGGGVWVGTDGKVVITGSRIVQNSAVDDGGLYLAAARGVTVSKSTVSYNKATTGETGGLYARTDGTGVILVDTCIVAQNSAAGSAGGIQIETDSNGKATVRNTLVTGNTAAGSGGGLYLEGGHLVVDHCTFVGNSAARGGGLGQDSGSNSLVIKNSRFLANQATDSGEAGGGALYLEGATPVTITASVFEGNTSAAGGGAIVNDQATIITITGSTFIANTAAVDGGAIDVHDGGSLTIKTSTLSGNIASHSGGAIAADTAAVLKATGNIITENHAIARDGGGIYTTGTGNNAVILSLAGNLFSNNLGTQGGAVAAEGGGKITMNGDKVLGNVATGSDGGGLYLESVNGITVTNVLVKGNQSFDDSGGMSIRGDATISGCHVLQNICDYGDGRGGGIFVSSGTVAIKSSVITGNVAADGGGIYDEATTTLSGTVVKGNSARSNPNTRGI